MIGFIEPIMLLVDAAHAADVMPSSKSRCLCILTPGVPGPDYFREIGADFDVGTPPDPLRPRAIMERHGLIAVAPDA